MLNGRRCGKTTAMKEHISAAVKAGQQIYIGFDYAHGGRDKTVELKLTASQLKNILFFQSKKQGVFYNER